MSLEKELAYYEAHKSELMKHYKGMFVLIKDDEFIGAYTTELQAYEAGVTRFGNQPMLIKKAGDDPDVTNLALKFGLIRAHS